MPTSSSPIEHVAILAGILKNIKEADLLKIASQVNAKAVNIPFSYNSYKLKPYAYLNFSSFESLEVAKELTIAFRNKGLTWHSLNEARNLCHVCGRHGCSPSTCSLRPAQTTNDRLDKLYSQFNAGLKHGQPDSRRTQSPSNSCSWSRSNSRSHNRTVTDRSNNSNRSIFSPSPARPHVRAPRSDIANSQHNANANVQSGFISGFSSPPSSQPMSSLPPDVIEELKSQLKDIAQQLKDLDEKIMTTALRNLNQ
uniref:RRM domain-containing protein n=1 Tax=Rhizophagus irregularis (strain DAOM 181602 / DAOM 197198 / MUCL 43194) TaxID=747089 RepID=U9U8V4_RHIID